VNAPPDVAIIGGGIVGCAAAAFLAEAGVHVDLYETEEVAAAASGRNSGSVQHPFDAVLRDLHLETLRHYRELGDFELPEEPVGVLMLARERAELEPSVTDVARDCPELAPALLGPDELRTVEPAVRPGFWGCRLETGYPVRPAAATRAFAKRAYAAGAHFHEGETAWPWVIGARARGVLAAGVRRPAGAVLVSAGPWTPEVIDPTRAWRPIVPVWGVVADVEFPEPPRHVLEEAGVEGLAASAGEGALFSLVAADGQVSLGSTFLFERPSPELWEGRLRRAGDRFVPGLRHAEVVGLRTCARPQSIDGRPLLGEVRAQEGLWVAAGHGPWGISTGPASARVVADAVLGRAEIPEPLSVRRPKTPPMPPPAPAG
jgi:glycine/D-amino acid oxidase-like deaminating enzyme